jgi:hypothetical protein
MNSLVSAAPSSAVSNPVAPSSISASAAFEMSTPWDGSAKELQHKHGLRISELECHLGSCVDAYNSLAGCA